jgi:peptide/nickel transport system substrate-binding protein
MDPQYAKQSVTHDPSVLSGIAGGLPADQKAITIGYDSSNPDNQLISNLLQTQLAAAGLTAKVQSYPTSEIYGWIGTDAPAAPEVFSTLAWPDAPSPYTWGHISWDADGGLNYLGCSAPPVTEALARGLVSGAAGDFSTAGLEALKTGCWLNVADVDDFMVAQPWLKGVEQAHVVTNPNSLRLAALSVG